MKVKKNREKTICNAMRCKNSVAMETGGGYFFCEKHFEVWKDEHMKKDQPSPEVEGGPEVIEKQLALELADQKQELDEAFPEIQAFEISTQDELAFVEEELALIKGQWKALEEKRKTATKPMNEALKAVNGWFKPVQKMLKDVETLWKKKIVDFSFKKEQERQALLVAAQGAETPEEIRETVIAASEAVAETTTTLIDRWEYTIVNVDVLPQEYLIVVPNEEKIAAEVAAKKGATNIPGVEVRNNPVVRSRSA